MTRKIDIKRLILLNLPYVFAFYFVNKIATVFRLAPGIEMVDKLTGGFANFGAAFANLGDEFAVDARGGRFLNHLLVPTLHRAVALTQIDGVAVLIGEHLDFDVARVLEEFLHVHRWIAERGVGFGTGGGDGVEPVSYTHLTLTTDYAV